MSVEEPSEELARIRGYLERLTDDIQAIATDGYDTVGPGAVFVSEGWLLGFPPGGLCYLPRSHPLFEATTPEIQTAVEAYDPENECVTLVASATDHFYLYLIYLRRADPEGDRMRFH